MSLTADDFDFQEDDWAPDIVPDPPAPELNSITLRAEIPLGATLHRSLRRVDSDGDTIYDEPQTVGEAVMSEAALLVKEALLREFGSRQGSGYGGLSKLYDDKLKARVEALVDAKVEEQLTRLVGPNTTLEAFIEKKVAAWLAESAGSSSYNRGPSRLEKAVSGVINRELEKALNATMADARQKALDAIAGVAQSKLTESFRQSIAMVMKGN